MFVIGRVVSRGPADLAASLVRKVVLVGGLKMLYSRLARGFNGIEREGRSEGRL